MAKHLLPVLNYAQGAQAIAACLRAKRAFLLLGSPGCAKTAVVRDASRATDLRCVDLIASNLDPTDIAGLPYRDNEGHVQRELFPEIRACCENAAVLFFDEATTMPKSVEGPGLRLVLERNAGGTPLHEESRVGMACNPPEQAPGGIELSAAMINRLILLRFQPSHDEIVAYFAGEPVHAEPAVVSREQFDAAREVEWCDFSATLGYATDLITWDPPRASIDSGEPWGSPRAWEIGLSAYAAHGAAYDAGKEDEVGFALLSGAVGPAAAASYLAIRRLRVRLPSVDEIRRTPDKAKVPETVDEQIAALGLLSRVAETDTWAAWIYANRLPKQEIAAACTRALLRKVTQDSPHAEAGRKAQTLLLAKLRRGHR